MTTSAMLGFLELNCLPPISSQIPEVLERKKKLRILCEEEQMRMTKERGMPSHCPYASNPYHLCGKYCSHKPAIDKDLVQNDQCNASCVRENPNKKVSAEVAESGATPIDVIEKDLGVNDERLRRVDPLCVHASNPFHKCSHYCTRRDSCEKVLPKGAKSVWGSNMMEAGRGAIFPLSASDGRKEKVLNVNPNNLNSSCPYASNPYHQCEKYCSPKTTQDTPGRKEKVLNVNTSNVNSSCPHASNPYHQCKIYCSQRTKQDTPESSMAIGVIQRKNTNPTCKYALNPYHKCDSHCSMKFNTVN